MYIKKYDEYQKLNELFVHKKTNNLNNKRFVLYKKDLWIFNEKEWDSLKIYRKINDAIGKDILDSSFDYSLRNVILYKHFNILSGRIKNKTIYVDGESGLRHSEHSNDLYKLKKTLGMDMKVEYTITDFQDKEEHTLNVDKMELKNRTFYHGTCLKFLPDILKKGLIPTSTTNYNTVLHKDKIFFTLNIEKAGYHAYHTSGKNESFPVIISFKVPDTSKLIVDYDLGRDMYGGDSKRMKKLGYDKVSQNMQTKGLGYKGDITNKIGVYGYTGRIPLSFIGDIWFDIQTFENNQHLYNMELGDMKYVDDYNDLWSEFNPVIKWSEIDKNVIMSKIAEIESYYKDLFNEEDMKKAS